MEDFASAGMMRLVAAGLARQRIPSPSRAPHGAKIPRAVKRDALLAVMAVHGPGAIVRIADAVQDMAPEPLVQALLKARDVSDLFARWRRLELFNHARHEVVIEPAGGDAFRLRHRARDRGPAPTQAETLLVVGVLAILAERLCGRAVRFGPEHGRSWRRNGKWSKVLDAPKSKCFVLAGTRAALNPAPKLGPTPGNFVDILRTRIAADPVRRWTVDDLAALAGMGPRTLQRRLTDNETSFSRLVAEARLQTAAKLLCDRSGSELAEVGFLSGYADQAHFTRSFSKAVGTTPRAYRGDFAG